MPLDGIFLYNLKNELAEAVGSRVDKISQPSRDELCLSLRGAGFSKKLFISARPGAARVHFTSLPIENPAVPPNFCMLMRKHLSGAKINSITQEGFERVIAISFNAVDEMGFSAEKRLICELIGSQANIILVAPDGRIIESVRRSDIETSQRLIQPGAVYSPPPPQDKLPPDISAAEEIIKRSVPLSKAILDCVAGVSPLTAREVAFYAANGDPLASEVDIKRLREGLSLINKYMRECEPTVLLEPDGTPRDFSYMPIKQYGGVYISRREESLSSLLDIFYEQRERAERRKRNTRELMQTLKNLSSRAEKKLALRKEELLRCADKDKFRIYGELIKANITLIERGSSVARVPDYYDENLATVEIPLSPALSPAANSAKYFKEYRKLCSAEQTLGKLIEDCRREKEYIDSVKDALERSETAAETADIREELVRAGYLKAPRQKSASRPAQKPREYRSSDGFRILVGRNNVQNDELTLKTAKKNDIWLHTKNIHGSHVLIQCDGITPPENTLIEAARLAAYHSQARQSSRVPVDYTAAKYVKKPSGAKPGMVIYTNNSTLFVDPSEI